MARTYNHRTIEKKWQEKWAQERLYETPDVSDKENFYALVEFAYPSGNLHVGHWYAFSVPDIFVRFNRMNGKNVLYPMGFDAFGLPAENAAIKRSINPKKWTYDNIDFMRKQLISTGASFDWSREVITSDPEYYKWTQWLFLQLYKKGLAYQAETQVNWCPSCQTVLANEQVVAGFCERCESTVDKKEMKQWLFKITDYADRLIDDLDSLDWPTAIKVGQKNWIGRSEGAEIEFPIKNYELRINVFTTRPDTLFGATYMVVAPEHSLIDDLKDQIENWNEVENYIKETNKKTEIERTTEGKDPSTGSVQAKTGVELTGIKAINPATKEEIPIWVADYVLPHYGTGAIMAVPAHDQRDYDFAKKYNVPIKIVVEPVTGEKREDEEFRRSIVALVWNPKTKKILSINWSKSNHGGNLFIGGGREEGEDPIECAKREIREETGYKNVKLIEQSENIHHHYFASSKDVHRGIDAIGLYFELLDEEREDQNLEDDEHGKFSVEWISSKQAEKVITDPLHKYLFEKFILRKVYIGNGIMTNSGKFDGMDSEEAKDAITTFVGGKKAKTYKLRDWLVSRQRYWGCPIPIVYCTECGTVPVPEKDLPVELPEIDDFMPRDDGRSPLSKVSSWVNVSCPKCGGDAQRETDTLDTFVDSSWYFLRYTDPHNKKEFASKEKMGAWMPVDVYSGGAEHTTMHLLYSRFFIKVLYDFGLVKDAEPYVRRMNRGLILGPDGNKMSKSRGNVVDPDEVVERLGADTVRMYLAFIGPYNEVGSYPWDPNGVVGIRRFIEKIWRIQHNLSDNLNEELEKMLHKTIKKVSEDIQNFKFNTAIAAMMIFASVIEKEGAIGKDQYRVLLQLLAPFAPHITEELWHELGNKESVHVSEWPEYDESKMVEETINLVVQVNGKVRTTIEIPVGMSEDEVRSLALENDIVKKWVGDKEITKFIYVKDKLVNIVV